MAPGIQDIPADQPM